MSHDEARPGALQPPRPSALAEEIGKWLEENPPDGYRGRYSAAGWAQIADAVLTAIASIKPVP